MSSGRPYRSSLFAGLLLILLGVIFFVDRMYPSFGIGHLIRVYWPVLLIVWGVTKLFDRLSSRGQGQAAPALLSGGEAVLLVLIAIVLGAFAFGDWAHQRFPDINIDLPSFRDDYSKSIPLPPETLQPGARVAIATGRGDVTVHAGDGDTILITAKKSGPGPSEDSALERMKDVDIEMEPQGNGVLIHPIHTDRAPAGVSVDIDVRVPKTSPVSIDAAHGDVSVSGISAPVEIRAGNGDVAVHDAGSDVTVQSGHGDVKVAGARGDLRLSGRGDDVDISNIGGNASIEGAFSGSIAANNVGQTFYCATQFSELTVSQLRGRLAMDSGDVSISDAGGDAKIVTRDKDVKAERVAGQLNIVDSHGDIAIHYDKPPRADLIVSNESADISLTLPSNSSFVLSALSRGGEVDSDFSGPALRPVSDENQQQLEGQFGSGGPKISLATTYGTIHIGKTH